MPQRKPSDRPSAEDDFTAALACASVVVWTRLRKALTRSAAVKLDKVQRRLIGRRPKTRKMCARRLCFGKHLGYTDAHQVHKNVLTGVCGPPAQEACRPASILTQAATPPSLPPHHCPEGSYWLLTYDRHAPLGYGAEKLSATHRLLCRAQHLQNDLNNRAPRWVDCSKRC